MMYGFGKIRCGMQKFDLGGFDASKEGWRVAKTGRIWSLLCSFFAVEVGFRERTDEV